MTPLERIAEAYWNAFRDGFVRVGGDPREYPLWSQSNDPVKTETLRCLRHAVETLKTPDSRIASAAYAAWDKFGEDATMGPEELNAIWQACLGALFPDAPTKRSIKLSSNDDEMAERAR